MRCSVTKVQENPPTPNHGRPLVKPDLLYTMGQPIRRILAHCVVCHSNQDALSTDIIIMYDADCNFFPLLCQMLGLGFGLWFSMIIACGQHISTNRTPTYVGCSATQAPWFGGGEKAPESSNGHKVTKMSLILYLLSSTVVTSLYDQI